MEFKSMILEAELRDITDHAISTAREFKTLDLDKLNYREHENSWSILQCIEHLNLYGDFYLPEIEKRIDTSKHHQDLTSFRSGFIGNYFANQMLVKNGKVNKMKSPKDKQPSASRLSMITIDRFIKQLEKLKLLLDRSKTVDLTKTKTAISISNLIKLRLGDTFRFFVYHIDRHMQQAKRVEQAASGLKTGLKVAG